ncbi:MAG: AsmA family protein [Xanthomonadales bacterium]|nr:AsmA family protein [Xanthomonadales bacterium]
MRRTIILAAALSIILLGLWGTAVIYFDEDRLKAIVSDRLSEQIGRRVEIVGRLRFSLFPSARIEAGGVIVQGPPGVPGAATLRADRVELALRLAPLLRGELSPGEWN